MTSAKATAIDAAPQRPRTVDIAGTAWPLFKLEALVAAVIVFLVAALIVQSLQVSVLAAAATGVIVWLAGSARQTPRSQ